MSKVKVSLKEAAYAASEPSTMSIRAPEPLEEGLARRILTPALVIDLAACRRNIAAVLTLTAGPARWRPHVKSAKVPEVLALYAEAGIRRFKCATTREAEVLARVLADKAVVGADILVAHHLFGPALTRMGTLANEHAQAAFSVLVESTEQISDVPPELGIFIDVDLGMARTGIAIERRDEIVSIARSAGERLRGLHAYDGHRTENDEAERARRIHASYDEVVDLCGALVQSGVGVREVITAGTPAFRAALEHHGLSLLEGVVHRVSPGTVVYHDLRSATQLPGLDAEFAATVLTRIASVREDGFTVDAGSKAVEGAGDDCIAEALELPGAKPLGQSEEHTVFRVAGGRAPTRGEALRLVPGHVCPTINLADEAILVEDGRYVGVASVAARAHETFVEPE